MAELIVTTTPTVEGRMATHYLGVVAGEAIMGANIFRDIFAGIRDIVGGRSGAYEEVMQGAREEALRDMADRRADQLCRLGRFGFDADGGCRWYRREAGLIAVLRTGC